MAMRIAFLSISRTDYPSSGFILTYTGEVAGGGKTFTEALPSKAALMKRLDFLLRETNKEIREG